MNRFKQKIKDYNDSIAMRGVHPSIASIAFNRKERFEQRIFSFVVESNEIEGVTQFSQHMKAEKRLVDLLGMDELTVADLIIFNKGHGRLRTNGECVRVGDHVPPKGGQNILYALEDIILCANKFDSPYDVHHAFETLHPFTDGNGRTGRALWLWQMINQQLYNIENKFLQQFYYQTLNAGR